MRTGSGVELEDDASIAETHSDEVAEPGRVVGVIEQQSVVGAGGFEHETHDDAVEGVTDRLVRDERRTIELRKTDMRAYSHTRCRINASGVVSCTAVRALVLGRFSQQKN